MNEWMREEKGEKKGKIILDRYWSNKLLAGS